MVLLHRKDIEQEIIDVGLSDEHESTKLSSEDGGEWSNKIDIE